MIRVLSDLHFRDATSKIDRLHDLEPLLDGVSELWINGDCCDNQSGMTRTELDEIRGFFNDRVRRVRFITGNHDPDISHEHEAQTPDGRVWATHGDVFLDDIVPWSRVRSNLLDRMAAVRRAHPELGFDSFEERIFIMRETCTGFARECDPERRDRRHLLKRLITELFPPRQPWSILRTWWTFADRVAPRAKAWRPQAQVILTGHVHFPRVWRRGPQTVINTGAFSGPLGAFAVDILNGVVTVRRVTQQDQRWQPGKVVTAITLADTPAPTVSHVS
ncbi:MAG: hypothetical protein SynsKO_44520 [Synoicihabitans sp.]